MIKEGINFLSKLISTRPISLDQFTDELLKGTDELILSTQKKENLQYLGGRLTALAEATQSEHFCLHLQLYFQNSQNKHFLKQQKQEFALNRLDEAAQKELQEKKSIVYAVDAPHGSK